jgi:hypothetical protein
VGVKEALWNDYFLPLHRPGSQYRKLTSGSYNTSTITRWLQDVFDVPLVFMLTDDEKPLFKDGLAFEDTLQYAMDNARDIITLGSTSKRRSFTTI